MSFKMARCLLRNCFGLLIVSTVGLGTAQPIRAEVVTSGYLVIDGQEIKPPFDVRIVGDSVTVNGISVYPYIKTPSEIRDEQEKKEVQRLLLLLHEEFVERKNSQGYAGAMVWLRNELKKHPKFLGYGIKETERGPWISLTGKFNTDSVDYSIVLTDHAPSKKNEKTERQRRWEQSAAHERAKDGRDAGFICLEKQLKEDPWVAEFRIDRENESYYFRWEDETDRILSRTAPRKGEAVEPQEDAQIKHDRLKIYHANRIVEALRADWCLIVTGGSVHKLTSGESACNDVLKIFQERMTRESADPIIQRRFNFPGSGKKFWRDIERYREIK